MNRSVDLNQTLQKIQITEEYGYREWVWEFPGTLAELVEDWRNGRVPLLKDHLTKEQTRPIPPYRGKLIRLTSKINPNEEWDAYAHIHMMDDTYLEINGVTVHGHPFDE